MDGSRTVKGTGNKRRRSVKGGLKGERERRMAKGRKDNRRCGRRRDEREQEERRQTF